MGRAPYALGAEEGEALWFFGTLLVLKATAEQTGGHFCLCEQRARQGTATPLHRQPADEETFFVLDGELQFFLGDGSSMAAGPGATVHVPAGTPHAFVVTSAEARFLNLTTPHHEAFFRAASDPAPAPILPPTEPPDMGKVIAAAEQFGVEILGPPPGVA
jgi:quercetin dioxygenase-like cupin family protein